MSVSYLLEPDTMIDNLMGYGVLCMFIHGVHPSVPLLVSNSNKQYTKN